MRDVDRALAVMTKNAERLSIPMSSMNAEDREQAQLYLERIAQMQALFKFAQLIITTILAQVSEMDFEDISGIEIRVD